jgi:preprotein translocase subunit SecA
MSDTTLLPLMRPVYPERAEKLADNWLDEYGERYAGAITRAMRGWRVRHTPIVGRIRKYEKTLGKAEIDEIRMKARELGKLLRRDGFTQDLVARSFALVSVAAERVLGMRPFDVQLLGGWVLLRGMVAEMETGEGKTLTATLPACTAALAGVHVHVITVNDYLVTRDSRIMAPLYEALGLTVGSVTEAQQPDERQAAYACHVTYGTNKVIVFDYLRDRITLGSHNSSLRLQMEKLAGGKSRVRKLLLRGLSFGIVDEADSVLIDEARTPLIISAPAAAGDEEMVAKQGIEIAKALNEGEHFKLLAGERTVALTDAGREKLEALCASLGGVWAGLMRREELAVQALTALHVFERDDHYLVRDGKIQIIDEYTGRVMADRSWERGIHQLIEVKEGCEVTAQKEPLARISYQRFFRRYLLLSGMTGTAREVASELGDVYGLPVVKIPTNRRSRRVVLPERVFPSEDLKWTAIASRIREIHAIGRPILLGTRSVAASERASELLDQMGIEHRVLNAKQDDEEANIVASAGERGRITIATNMAGRGTDIKLAEEIAALGGLHVILSERHDSERIDRQLAGRCARQGDPGFFEPILSIEGTMQSLAPGPLGTFFSGAMAALGPGWTGILGSFFIRQAQKHAERSHSRTRKALLKMDQQLGKVLSFSGRYE